MNQKPESDDERRAARHLEQADKAERVMVGVMRAVAEVIGNRSMMGVKLDARGAVGAYLAEAFVESGRQAVRGVAALLAAVRLAGDEAADCLRAARAMAAFEEFDPPVVPTFTPLVVPPYDADSEGGEK